MELFFITMYNTVNSVYSIFICNILFLKKDKIVDFLPILTVFGYLIVHSLFFTGPVDISDTLKMHLFLMRIFLREVVMRATSGNFHCTSCSLQVSLIWAKVAF